jgi:predicted phosphodiesterase
MAVQVGRTLVVNPGSTGDGRDERNARALSYAVLDTASGEVTFDNFVIPR